MGHDFPGAIPPLAAMPPAERVLGVVAVGAIVQLIVDDALNIALTCPEAEVGNNLGGDVFFADPILLFQET